MRGNHGSREGTEKRGTLTCFSLGTSGNHHENFIEGESLAFDKKDSHKNWCQGHRLVENYRKQTQLIRRGYTRKTIGDSTGDKGVKPSPGKRREERPNGLLRNKKHESLTRGRA